MYLAHFGLNELPFGITPDTQYVYSAVAHQEALNTLLVGIGSGEGFIKISGEVGTGKTLLCRRLLATLAGEGYVTAYLFNPYAEPYGLLMALAGELGLQLPVATPPHHLMKLLNLALLKNARGDKSVVLCLDEAQALPKECLEAVRNLSNLETEKRKLIQIVLFGQPELDAKLADHDLRQLRQRIAFHYRMPGLRRDELEHYLNHRLRVAGYRGNLPFTRAAVKSIYKLSKGTPRLVNILAHKSLLAAFGEGRSEVEVKHVRQAGQDTESVPRPGWRLF
ncbi:MAG: AAA family ATPase [Rhodocyclaceae bacterium]|nr:AAA family ATPase [Rhodocyclaceae bacterium]